MRLANSTQCSRVSMSCRWVVCKVCLATVGSAVATVWKCCHLHRRRGNSCLVPGVDIFRTSHEAMVLCGLGCRRQVYPGYIPRHHFADYQDITSQTGRLVRRRTVVELLPRPHQACATSTLIKIVYELVYELVIDNRCARWCFSISSMLYDP